MSQEIASPQQELIVCLQKQLVETLLRHKKKPYLPVWGELYSTLREFIKIARQSGQNLLLYPISPTGSLHFMHQTGLFRVDIPDPGLTISLSTDELIEALIAGRFFPAKPNCDTTSRFPE
ncbi:hypothetical protein [Brevibacillus borstelensis]|uniref:hypothetical protein n=1 Tax=Brevibacillus borstelensis TaxID=45462 RepID=UPI0030BBCA80